MKTSELTGKVLYWAVAKCEGFSATVDEYGCLILRENVVDRFDPSTNWGWGGPIIERERVGVEPLGADATWMAQTYNEAGRVLQRQYGPTPLIAAMRCYVASKFGKEVAVP